MNMTLTQRRFPLGVKQMEIRCGFDGSEYDEIVRGEMTMCALQLEI
jgi:hypothetical protein